MILGQIFSEKTVIVNLESTEKDELFEEMAVKLQSLYPELDRAKIVADLTEREEKMTTGIMHSVAIPHAVVSGVKGTIGAIGITQNGIDYDSLDKAPVYVVFMLLAGDGETESHIQVLKQLATVLQIPNFVKDLLECRTASQVYNFICKSEEYICEGSSKA